MTCVRSGSLVTMTEGLNAYLLHHRAMKGSSTQVFFITRETGLVRAFCRAGRSKTMRATLQPFTPLWLTIKAKHFGAQVDKVEVASPAHILQQDNLIAGLYLNELLFKLLKPEGDDIELFGLYEHALKGLTVATTKPQLEICLRQFEFKLLDVLGYGPSFSEEAGTGRAIQADKQYVFVPKEGFNQANSGISGASILAIGNHAYSDREILRDAKRITRMAIDALLEGDTINTRELYVQVS